MLPTLFWGIIAAQGVYSAATSSFLPMELARQVKQGLSNLIVCSADCKDTAIAAAKECGIPLDRVLVLESNIERSLRDLKNGQDVISDQELDWKRITDKKELDDSVICLLYSSGTTGVPKGVNLSHTNIVAEGLIPQYMYREWEQRQAARKIQPMQYRTLAHLPAAHIAGVQGYLINPAVAGGTVYWMPKFDFTKFLEYNKKYQITTFFTVPPVYLLIAKSPQVTDQFKSLRHSITGAAPMGPELTALAEAKLGSTISQTWGLSETTGSVTAALWDEHDATGSVSPLMPNTSMRITDDDDNDVEEGKPGELLMKGPMVTNGYWRNEQATKESFTSDGWFKTGDIGERRNGMFYVVDRKKVGSTIDIGWFSADKKQELIKYKGLQVAPAELEALLLSHDQIRDAAVIGISAPDGSGNELPRAYVVSKMPEQEIKDFVKANFAQHKQLRGGVIYLDVIPKSASGKILRRELREMAKKEAKAQGPRL
jgi:4-coumarate--CoA ligase